MTSDATRSKVGINTLTIANTPPAKPPRLYATARYDTIEWRRASHPEDVPEGRPVEKIPGRRLVKKAEETGNEVEVPLAQNLGLVDLLKHLAKEVQEDHLAAF